jgi:hypothetical protein
MFRIDLTPHSFPSTGSLEDEGYVFLKEKVRYLVKIGINDVSLSRGDAPLLDVAGEMITWLLSLGHETGGGYISFGYESLLFYRNSGTMVSFYHYDPADIFDPSYHNEIGSVTTSAVVQEILTSLAGLIETLPNQDKIMRMDGPPFLGAVQLLILSYRQFGEVG